MKNYSVAYDTVIAWNFRACRDEKSHFLNADDCHRLLSRFSIEFYSIAYIFSIFFELIFMFTKKTFGWKMSLARRIKICPKLENMLFNYISVHKSGTFGAEQTHLFFSIPSVTECTMHLRDKYRSGAYTFNINNIAK